MQVPYIGVTGFTGRDEVAQVLQGFPFPPYRRKFMVGVLASRMTFWGLPNKKYPMRYPRPGDIAEIFPDDRRALNLIHYATDERESLANQLKLIKEHYAGPHCHGFQLNIKWPDMHVLELLKKTYPGIVFVLQVGGGAMETVLKSPARIARMISAYDGLADYALLDPSGGEGRAIDPRFAMECLDRLHEIPMRMRLGFAGGLSDDSLPTFAKHLQAYPDLSVDAEGQLRDEHDRLSIEAACRYRNRAIEMLP